MELDLWLNGRLVASTVSRDRGRKVRIEYDAAVAAAYGPEVPLLSCSLPTPGPTEPASTRAFLEGLLPEGRALDVAAAQVRGVRLQHGAPETAADAVALLAEFGRECAGAVVVMPEGQEPPAGGRYEPLDDSELEGLVLDIPQHPLGVDLERGVRMSLGGAQDKLLLARIDGRWCRPLGGAPSTHIIKPATTWPHSAHNEALVLELGRVCGLTGSDSWVELMGGTAVLVAERYDRRAEDGQVVRLHQEDMCQAVGLRPSDKYEIGRPSARMARVVRQFTSAPAEQLDALFRQVAFRAVVGDEDSHGKNFSLMLDEGQVTVAPLYDAVCTLGYPNLSGTMGTPLGAQRTLAKVDRTALVDEAHAMGLTSAQAAHGLDALAADLRLGLEQLDDRLTTGWPSERIIDIVRTRVDRLESGQSLGDAGMPRAGAARSLDQQTAARQGRVQD